MNSTQEWIRKLEIESKALKQGFALAGTQVSVITTTGTHTTSKNEMTISFSGGSSNTNDPERVIVTFNTIDGSKTIAKLEVTTDNNHLPKVHRVPYSAGARWSVTAASKNGLSGGFSPTRYTFAVQSLIDGTISTSEVSS